MSEICSTNISYETADIKDMFFKYLSSIYPKLKENLNKVPCIISIIKLRCSPYPNVKYSCNITKAVSNTAN
jgi:hypothetical protein